MARGKKKNKFWLEAKRYLYSSIIFGLMMTGFNFIFLIFSLRSSEYSGVFLNISNIIVLDSILNMIIDFVVLGGVFWLDCYLLLNVIISPNKKR